MCLRYVNATIEACQRAAVAGSMFDGYVKPFDHALVSKNEQGRWQCPAFDAVLRITILGTAHPEKNPENPILKKKFLAFRLNMTQCHEDKSKRLTKVLDHFSVDLAKVKLDEACYKFYSMRRVVRVSPLLLPSDSDKYALKLFAMALDSEPEGDLASLDWDGKSSIQTLCQIHFEEASPVSEDGSAVDQDRIDTICT